MGGCQAKESQTKTATVRERKPVKKQLKKARDSDSEEEGSPMVLRRSFSRTRSGLSTSGPLNLSERKISSLSWLRGYSCGECTTENEYYVVKMGDTGGFKVYRGDSSNIPSGGIDSKQNLIIEPMEDELVAMYNNEGNGEGTLVGTDWEVDVQTTAIGKHKRVLDLVRNDRKFVQIRLEKGEPVAIGYPQPFQIADSSVTLPTRAVRRPYFNTEKPNFVTTSELLASFKHGVFNICIDDSLMCRVRSQSDRSPLLHALHELDLAILLGFMVARMEL
eukprot:TRINITY_DN8528_c0_g2_i1.p1 TRINITY_DN8528_c0_g2~~TRINITY_DN8528_c0_g2_i1.p1  ORF type:complete len:276 (+),score=43.94 TRINITY_DN8528_c0_g2_i1:125-952(+)